MIDCKKAKIEGRITTVVNPYDVLKDQSLQNKYTSVEINGFVLPVKTNYDSTNPGFYISGKGNVGVVKYPSNNDIEEYSTNNIIDFSNVSNMKELIAKQEEVKQLECEVLSNSDNLFKPVAKENDTPEMKALKKAICLKNIDLDVYADRFADNYNNDKRLIKSSSITMAKMKSIGEKLDMKITLTISDANPNVPNPMRESVTVDICGTDNSED